MSMGGNKNALNRELGVDGRRDWSYGLFDCTSECGLCTLTSLVKNSRLFLLTFSGRLLGGLVSLRGLLQKQTAPPTSA